jgi:3-phosphoshikimate 1-carboxyvinyltransferase
MHNSLTLQPASALRGILRVPGDKSISHRALMLGALAEGETIIQGLLPGEDPISTARCLSALGAEITEINSTEVRVRGTGLGQLKEATDFLDAGNSGTTLRLMMGILASQPGLFSTLTGDASLRSRPMGRVSTPLSQMGAQIWGRQGGKYAPLAIQGQSLKPFHYQSPIASAQVKSAVLLAGLLTPGQTLVTEPARSRDHSERMLRAFGAKVYTDESLTVAVEGPTRLVGQTVVVPGDISSAAFWLVAASIVPDSELLLENVGINPTRTGILDVLQAMGADIEQLNLREQAGEPVADLRVRSAQLRGTTIGGSLIPRLVDEIPVLAIAALAAEGKTIIRDAEELRVKESDRLAVMVQELHKMGAQIQEHPDGLEIHGPQQLIGANVSPHTDHRIAMSLAIASLLARGETTLENPECARVSYPEFWTTLDRVRKVIK